MNKTPALSIKELTSHHRKESARLKNEGNIKKSEFHYRAAYLLQIAKTYGVENLEVEFGPVGKISNPPPRSKRELNRAAPNFLTIENPAIQLKAERDQLVAALREVIMFFDPMSPNADKAFVKAVKLLKKMGQPL